MRLRIEDREGKRRGGRRHGTPAQHARGLRTAPSDGPQRRLPTLLVACVEGYGHHALDLALAAVCRQTTRARRDVRAILFALHLVRFA